MSLEKSVVLSIFAHEIYITKFESNGTKTIIFTGTSFRCHSK